MKIRVLLADDHAVVRDGLRAILEAGRGFEVVGVAADAHAALAEARRLAPDVVVMDISMGGTSGIEATRRIAAEIPATRVLILSMHDSAEHVYRALQAGARGYLLKESAGAELIAALRAVHAGRRFLTGKISETMISAYLDRPGASPLERLSPRELDLLQLLVEGHGNREAAKVLSLSVKTVETYRSRMMQKLGIRDLPGLVKFAIQHGLTELK